MAELSLFKLNKDIAAKADKTIVSNTTDGLMSAADKVKLDGITAEANKYVLPIASNSTLGGIKIGTGINIDGNAIISVPVVTTSANGLMTFTDKNKLDSIGSNTNTNDYVLPKATTSTLGGVIVSTGLTIDTSGILTTNMSQIKSDIGVVTNSNNGLMSIADKTKLDGLTTYTLPTATGNVLGGIKIGTGVLINSGVLSVPNASASIDGLMLSTDKTKLDGIAANANNYTLPMASSSVCGGVKIGTGINIDSNGIISIPNATMAINGLMSSTDKLKLDSLSESGSSGTIIAFGFTYPMDNGESPRYIVKKNTSITNIDVYSTTAPSDNVSIQVYKGSIAISTISISKAGITSTDVSFALVAGDIIYIKINGSINGIINLTVELLGS